MPGQKLYIVSRPELVSIVERQPKILAFPPVAEKFASQLCGVSQEARKIVQNNILGEEGPHGMSLDSYVLIRTSLSPCAEFDEMNRQMIGNATASLRKLEHPDNEMTSFKLYAWLRQHVTASVTNSVYGPQNPFKEQAVIDAFWYVEHTSASVHWS